MKLHSLNTGFFKLDGGGMFGVIPRSMWEKANPPDDNNMCTWALRVLLIQTPSGRNIIVDTGLGNFYDEKFVRHYEPTEQQNFDTLLSQKGLSRMDITDVFLTHLHFDHCGGALTFNEHGKSEVTFPKATYWTNKQHFDWAMNPNPREKASFLKPTFLPLMERNRLKFIETKQNIAFDDNLRVRFFHGHTTAMMALYITLPDGKEVIYCADVLPAQWYVGMPWVLAFDIRPLQSLKEKKPFLERALKRNQVLMLEHDPFAEVLTLKKDEKRDRIVVEKTGNLVDFI